MTKVVSNYIELHVIKIENDEMKFLLLKRSPYEKYPEIWQMVTGKIKENEKAFEAAIRELKEETGLEMIELFVVPQTNSVYLPETDEINIIPIFVCRVKENSKVTISKEHTEYRWSDSYEATKLLAWRGQKKTVEMIHYYWFNDKSKLIKIV